LWLTRATSHPYPCRSATRQQQSHLKSLLAENAWSSRSANQETAHFLQTQKFTIAFTAAQPPF
jgi:hypothetical protein